MSAPIPIYENRRLEALHSFDILDTPPEEAFDSLTRFASRICGTPIALIALVDAERLWFKSKVGVEMQEVSRDISFCTHAILRSEPMIVPDATKDPRFSSNPAVVSPPGVRFYCGIPLLSDDGMGLGTLCVVDTEPRQLCPQQVEDLNVLAEQVVSQLLLRRTVQELNHQSTELERMVDLRTRQLRVALRRVEFTYDDTLQALGAALDLRDNETAGHSRRVTRFSLEIARAMACGEEELQHIERGSYLHDIGKIGLPDSVLLKPAALTPDERKLMESHVRIGYDLVRHVAFLARAAEIVLTHQERFDGTGYPQGLMGAEIPLGARIFSVADTLDAMTSDRPYRKALPFAEARDEIMRESGRQFDPEVVKAFCSVPEEVWHELREEGSGIKTSLSIATAVSGQ